MGALGDVLTPAVGVAVSPMPIVAVILMLFTPRAKANGIAFAAGWVVGLLVVEGLVLVLADPANVTEEDGGPSTLGAILHLLLGLGLFYLAFMQWKKRPVGNAEPTMPKWMQSIDKISPLLALGFGALMSGINPKNLIFNIAAGTAVAQDNLGTAQSIGVVLVYVVIASIPIVGIVTWAMLAGAGATATLDKMKNWLMQNNAIVMMVLLGILGVSQLGKAIGGL